MRSNWPKDEWVFENNKFKVGDMVIADPTCPHGPWGGLELGKKYRVSRENIGDMIMVEGLEDEFDQMRFKYANSSKIPKEDPWTVRDPFSLPDRSNEKFEEAVEAMMPKEIPLYHQGALAEQVGGDHYKSMSIQPVTFIQSNDLSFLEGNIIKYCCRHKQKGGRADIEKVIHYAKLILELEYSNDG